MEYFKLSIILRFLGKGYAQSSYMLVKEKKKKEKKNALSSFRNIFSDTWTLRAYPHTSHSASVKPHYPGPPDPNHGSISTSYHDED